MSSEMLRMLIGWAPTILFAIAIIVGIVIGVIRGFRKSMILFIHMLVIGGICVGLYIWLFSQKNTDEIIVKFSNQVLGWFNTSLQKLMGVSGDSVTLTDMILEKILSSMSNDQLIAAAVIEDNAMYVATIVEMAYRIILFILVGVLYYILAFVMYIIYLFFYPVRRKTKKYNASFSEGKKNHLYKKRRLAGGLIGGLRTCISSIIGLSFLGALIFILSGGVATPKRDEFTADDSEISFGDSSFNEIYDYYSSICAMGDTGIFKVLNTMKDSKNTPYYFYIADLVLQGGITDENQGLVNQTFYFRDETGSYIGFCKKVFNAIVTYGGEDIEAIMNSGTNDEKITNLCNIMASKEFAAELTKIIDEFESKTYFVNLALSALTSIVNHVDLLGLSPSITGLVKCMFTGENSIKVSDLATGDDIRTLFKAVINVIATETPAEGFDTAQPLAKIIIPYAKGMIHEIQKLSVFTDTTRREKANNLFGKVYMYCASEFLQEGATVPTIPEEMDWMNELDVLLSATDPLLSITNEIYDTNSDVMMENMLCMFNSEHAEFMKVQYDKFSECLLSSCVLDIVFKSSLVGNTVDKMVQSIVSKENITIPHDLQYSNTKDENGNIVLGETYYMLKSLRYILEQDILGLLSAFTASDASNSEKFDEIFTFLGAEVVDGDSKEMLVNKILDSNLMYYIVSTIITNFNFGADLYLTNEITEVIVEGETEFTMVAKEELKLFVSSMINCKDVILPVLDNSENMDYASILSDDKLYESVDDSLLLQCVLSSVVIKNIINIDAIDVPFGYDNGNPWINSKTSEGNVVKGELVNLMNGVKAMSDTEGFDVNSLFSGEINFNSLNKLKKSTIDQLLESKVLLYTINDSLQSSGTDSFKIVVPYASIDEIGTTIKDKEIKIIKKEELSSAITSVLSFAKFEDSNVEINYKKLFEDKETLLSNLVIQATIIDLLISTADKTDAVLAVPAVYRADAAKLKTEVPVNNVWFASEDSLIDDEVYQLFDLLEESLGEIPEDFDIAADLENKLKFKESIVPNLSNSAVLNATIAKNLVSNDIACPISVYENELISDSELPLLFNGMLNMFGEVEEGQTEKSLTLTTMKTIDIDSFVLKKSDVDLIVQSKILSNKLSGYVLDVNAIKIPLSATAEISVINETGAMNVVTIQSGANSELKALLDSMFDLFGTTEGQTTVVNVARLNEMDFNKLTIKRSSKQNLLKSQTICATLTSQLTGISDLVVPMDVLGEKQDIYQQESKGYIADNIELDNVLDGLFAMFGVSTAGDTTIQINDIDVSSITLHQSKMGDILESKIMSMTISKNLINLEVLDIPASSLLSKSIYSSTDEVATNLDIEGIELSNLIAALFVMFGQNDIENDMVLNVSNSVIDVGQITISKAKLEICLSSEIMSSTISAQVLNVEDLKIPSNVQETVDFYDYKIQGNASKAKIVNSEINSLVSGLLITSSGELGISSITLKSIQLPETKAEADSMVESFIISATFSDKIEKSNALIPDKYYTNYSLNSSFSEQRYIEQSELSNLIISISNGLGFTNVATLDLTTIKVPSASKKEVLLESAVIRTTISDKVLGNAAVEKNCTDAYELLAINEVVSIVLSSTELSIVIDGIQLIHGEEGSFTDLSFDINNILTSPNKESIINTISTSAIYRSIVSDLLNKSAGLTIYKVYQMLWKKDSVTTDYIWETETIGVFGDKEHIQSSTLKNVLKKTGNGYEETSIQLFTQADIQALIYCAAMSQS